jgi:P pilus assembly chaperone PapD
MRFRFIGLALAITALLAIPNSAWAQAQGSQNNIRGLTISPLTFDIDTTSQRRVEREVRVDNITDTTLTLQGTARNFLPTGESSRPRIVDEDTPYGITSWITITPAQFTLEPKKFIKLKISLDVPPNADPGGHYGAVTVKTVPNKGTGQVAIVQEIATLLLVKVPGDIKEQASIESFAATPGITQRGPVKLHLRINNTGNMHIKPLANVTITNIFGRKVAELPYEKGYVIPKSIRRYTTTWSPDWVFGPYTATVNVVYGQNNQVLQAKRMIWGLPIVPIAIGVAVIALLATFFYKSRDRFKAGFSAFFGKKPSKKDE